MKRKKRKGHVLKKVVSYAALFFAGEMIGFDGPCGGFNLENAWETGLRAARAVADHMERSGWAGTVTVEDGVLRLRYLLRDLSGAAFVVAENSREAAPCIKALRSVLPAAVTVQAALGDRLAQPDHRGRHGSSRGSGRGGGRWSCRNA